MSERASERTEIVRKEQNIERRVWDCCLVKKSSESARTSRVPNLWSSFYLYLPRPPNRIGFLRQPFSNSSSNFHGVDLTSAGGVWDFVSPFRSRIAGEIAASWCSIWSLEVLFSFPFHSSFWCFLWSFFWFSDETTFLFVGGEPVEACFGSFDTCIPAGWSLLLLFLGFLVQMMIAYEGWVLQPFYILLFFFLSHKQNSWSHENTFFPRFAVFYTFFLRKARWGYCGGFVYFDSWFIEIVSCLWERFSNNY